MGAAKKMAAEYKLHDSTGHWMSRVFTAMRREFDKELRAHGVTISDWAVLAGLHGGEARTPTELARLAGLDRAVVTRSLDRLTDEKSFTHRELNNEDRRSFTIRLTPAGKRVAAKLLAANKRINDMFLGGLSKGSVNELRRTLKHMLENAPK